MSGSKTITFSGKGQPGDLLDPDNWVGDVVPGIADTALITMNVGGPVGGIFSVNNMMLLGSETITFTGTLDTAGTAACQGLMVCDGAVAIFAPGATLNDGNALIVGNDAVGLLRALGNGTTHSVLNSVVANIGKQDAGVGTVTIDDAVWTNSGHAYIGDDGAGKLNVINNGSIMFGAAVDMAAGAGSSGTLAIASGGSVVVAGALRAGVATTAASGVASIKVGSGGGLTVDDTLAVGSGSELDVAGGTVTAGVTADCLRTLAGGVIAGHGTLTAPVTEDDGTILASGGDLQVNGNVIGTGAIEIAAHSTATLTGANLKLASIAFLGADGTLSLAHGSNVTAAISGFAIGDAIAMPDVDAVSFDAATGRLTLSEHNAQVATLHLTGGFAGDEFAIHQTAGGAVITLQHLLGSLAGAAYAASSSIACNAPTPFAAHWTSAAAGLA
jgi:T5SS/PEP-CTERM-associated repeat protein